MRVLNVMIVYVACEDGYDVVLFVVQWGWTPLERLLYFELVLYSQWLVEGMVVWKLLYVTQLMFVQWLILMKDSWLSTWYA